MARYVLRFRHSDTGLTPVFTFFKKVSDLSAVSPPSIVEIGDGCYYFDYTPTFDITFEVDGGASIPTEEVRYIADTISPRDTYLDEPVSQVRTDVWSDSTAYSAGQKGRRVDQLGDPSDTSVAATVFGKAVLYKESIRGDSAGLSDGNNTKQVYDRIGAPVAASISADIANVQTASTDIYNRIGAPANASIAADIAEVVSTIGAPVSTVSADIAAVKAETASIKAKTDNLPADPASQATTNTSITTAQNNILGPDSRDLTDLAGAGFTSGDSLVGIKTAVDNLVAPDNASIATILADTAKIGDATDVSGANTIFGKTYESRDAVMGVDSRDLTELAGSGFSSATMSLSAAYSTLLRVTGMLHENSVLDGTQFDGNNNMLTGRLRLYDSKANAEAAVAVPWPGVYDTGKIAEYSIVATYTGSNLQTYAVTKVP